MIMLVFGRNSFTFCAYCSQYDAQAIKPREDLLRDVSEDHNAKPMVNALRQETRAFQSVGKVIVKTTSGRVERTGVGCLVHLKVGSDLLTLFLTTHEV